jgi:hypothetical protein
MRRLHIGSPRATSYAIGIMMMGALLIPPITVGDSLGMRRFLTPEITQTLQVGQRFRMDSDGLSAIEISPAAVDRVAGRFRLTVRAIGQRDTERSIDVAGADLIRHEVYVFRFAPFELSRDRLFEFRIVPASHEPGRGIALWATKGERLEEGGLLINNTLRWASLTFRTATPAGPLLQELLAYGENAFRVRWFVLVLLIGYWVALHVALRTVAQTDDESVLEG